MAVAMSSEPRRLLLLCLVAASAVTALLAAATAIRRARGAMPYSDKFSRYSQWTGAAFREVSNESISDHLKQLTKEPHMAGKGANIRTAEFVEGKFKEYGLETHHVDYPVLLSYPLSLSLSISFPTPLNFSLREQSFPEDPYSAAPSATTPFLAYSPNGTAEAEVVYANYGRTEDFEELDSLGVNCSGKIVLARYGKIFRGDKVQGAQVRGAVGVVLYSDPADYAPLGTDPSQVYPHGSGLPPSGAQRGSIFLLKGDPETPGWESTFEGERLAEADTKQRLPRIPALPIGYSNAEHILRALGGPEAPQQWQGGIPGVAYHLGPGAVVVQLTVQMNQTRSVIRNVIGMIQGKEEPDRYVIVGNHRDAWVDGAADPNSGTTCMLEMARALGALRRTEGWVPRRTLVFCSWDGEEPALIGSTEWVEGNLPLLSLRALAYVNVDVAVAGGPFHAETTPQLDQLIKDTAALVQDPSSPQGTSVADAWAAAQNSTDPQPGRLGGGGSDFAGFLQHAGIAAVDMAFGNSYPMYHSLYDNYHWMKTFVDPIFAQHVAMTQLWIALTLRLTNDLLLPYNYTSYVEELQKTAEGVQATLECIPEAARVDLSPLLSSLHKLSGAADTVQRLRVQRTQLGEERELLNDQLAYAERGFLDQDGIGQGREWFKHLVYGPERDNGYGTLPFPSINDAINALRKHLSSGSEREAAAHASEERSIELGGQMTLQRQDGVGGTRKWRKRSLEACNRHTLGVPRRNSEALVDAVQHEVFRTARAISRAAQLLKGQLD